VFFFLSGGWGPLVRTLPIITRLAEHGIASSVSVAGLAPRLRDAGFDVIEPAVPAFGAPAEAAPGWWSPYHFLVHHGHDIKRIVAHVEAYRKTIQDGKPCVVVTDINPAAALAARSLQAIHFTISQSLFLPFRNLTSSRWRLPAAALPVINEVLQHYGFAAIQTAEHLDVGDVTFLPSIPEFDPLDDPPSSVQYAGPILGNRLIPFAPSAERPCATRPWILFYPGRPHDAAGRSGQTLFDVGLQALSAVTARVTVATGGHDFAIPQQAQARFEIVPWHVLSSDGKPDLMVHHGGHGSCLTAISAGIPSVVVPTHAEREYNARNLVALGCGEMLLSPEPDALRLREAVENVLETPGYAAKCAQWSRTIAERKYGGPDLVVRMIMQTTAGITCAGAP
jgi:UDP:flavonoid glycosyltransferase YjiC (YdhE family)